MGQKRINLGGHMREAFGDVIERARRFNANLTVADRTILAALEDELFTPNPKLEFTIDGQKVILKCNEIQYSFIDPNLE